mmetsp:Transcript_29897/g.71074  ORF Transcript_29897/g.71074 Transcript_29897/m.71074 type:complete len:205 (-) Transcript_29897:1521-2135(-)
MRGARRLRRRRGHGRLYRPPPAEPGGRRPPGSAPVRVGRPPPLPTGEGGEGLQPPPPRPVLPGRVHRGRLRQQGRQEDVHRPVEEEDSELDVRRRRPLPVRPERRWRRPDLHRPVRGTPPRPGREAGRLVVVVGLERARQEAALPAHRRDEPVPRHQGPRRALRGRPDERRGVRRDRVARGRGRGAGVPGEAARRVRRRRRRDG